MGSLGAMKDSLGSRERYGQPSSAEHHKLVPEGVEGRIPYRGNAQAVVAQLVGGLRSGMGYLGARTLEELRNNAHFVRMTPAGFKESHVHDIAVTKEAPNYPV
jgi:IMP dehydrogenase